MAVYAPLFASVNLNKWPANAVNFDNYRAYGTPSYYAQLMLANNTGDINIGVGRLEGLLNKKLFVNANRVRSSGEIIVKIVNSEGQPREIQINLRGMRESPDTGREIVLAGPDLKAGNSFDAPTNVAPVERKLDKAGMSFNYVVRPYSFTVLRLMP